MKKIIIFLLYIGLLVFALPIFIYIEILCERLKQAHKMQKVKFWFKF